MRDRLVLPSGGVSLAHQWRTAWRPPDRRQIWEWAAENVILPAGVYTRTGAFDIQSSRYLLEPLEALHSDIVRVVSIRAPVRSGKSLIADIWLPWVIANDPGPFMFNLSTDKLAKRYMDTRVRPVLQRVAAIQHLLPPKLEGTDVLMTNGMPLYVQGPAIGNLTGVPVRYLVDDELWERKEGKHEEAEGRLGDAEKLGHAKQLNLSQGGNEGDDMELEMDGGVLRELHVPCLGPRCNEYMPTPTTGYRDDVDPSSDASRWGLKWDNHRLPSGDWNLAKVLPTVRFECRRCGFPHIDNNRTRIEWNRLMRYQTVPPLGGGTSPSPSGRGARGEGQTGTSFRFSEQMSYHYYAVITRAWDQLVRQFLEAQNAKRRGNFGPLIVYTQKRDAMPNRPGLGSEQCAPAIETFTIKKDGEPEGWMRFLTVDCQRDLVKLYAIVRDWNRATGDSRRIFRGIFETFDQVRDKQIELGIADNCVFVDIGYEQHRVCQHLVKYGRYAVVQGERRWLCWWGLKGSSTWDFAHHDDKAASVAANAGEKAPRRMFSTQQNADPGAGRYKSKHMAPFWIWSNDQAGNILGRLLAGQGAKFTAPPIDKTDPAEVALEAQYVSHLNSHRKFNVRERGRWVEKWLPLNFDPNKPASAQQGPPDHFRDCELEQIIAAAAAGILGE